MDPMEQIRDLASRIESLDDDERAGLKDQVVKVAKGFKDDDNSPETIAILNECADVLDAVRVADAAAAQAKADAAEQAKSVRARIAGETTDDPAAKDTPNADDPAGDPDAEDDDDENKDKNAAEGENADANAEAGKEPALVASGKRPGTTIGRMARAGEGGGRSIEVSGDGRNRAVLTAAAPLVGVREGTILTDREQLANAMCKTLRGMKRTSRAQGDVIVAAAEWEYPEDRQLTDDLDVNSRLVDRELQSLLATGGICSPVNIDYSLDTWAVADRPLRDGLNAYQASRGGLTWRQPVDFGSLLSATGVWTEATDLNPGGATKPVVSVACQSPTTTYTSAVSTRLGFGNMLSRFDPETVAMNTDLAIAAAAQVAELNLLAAIDALAVAQVATAQVLGAARDFVTTLTKSSAIYRNIHRMADTQMLAAILPRWVRDLILVDRQREAAHDGQAYDVFTLGYEWVDSLFAARNIKPIWILDPAPLQASGVGYPLQGFAAFTANAALQAFPTKIVMRLYPEGAIQFLDGGRLDLGVVRDSTLDATNDYETFVETFEAVANRGFTTAVVQFVISLCANGVASAPAAPGTCL